MILMRLFLRRLILVIAVVAPLIAGEEPSSLKIKISSRSGFNPSRAGSRAHVSTIPSQQSLHDFLYDNDQPRPIWMKNCLISLDVAWTDHEGRIVGLIAKIPPCPPSRGEDCPMYGGQFIARHFVEFSAGTIARLNLKIGDRLSWDITLDDGRRVQSPARR